MVAAGACVVAITWALTHKKKFTGERPENREKVVVLGTGWASMHFVKTLDTNFYDVTVVSPRNYFLYTPLLAGATVGTVEPRSLVEPIREFLQRNDVDVKFYEAKCVDIDPVNNTVTCSDQSDVKSSKPQFTLPYDQLVVGVGSVPNTMNTPGVDDYCMFLKQPSDATRIRDRIMDCFESSNFPDIPLEDRQRLLHFVIVGGGPTGVEFAAELHDFIKDDVSRVFKHLLKDVKITVVQSADKILNTYDAKLSTYAEEQFSRDKLQILKNTRVTSVSDSSITVLDKTKNTPTSLPYGLCVWSAGIGPNELLEKFMKKIPQQTNTRGLTTDEFLKVKGTKNIYAIGDCATVSQAKLLDKFVELFQEADANGDGTLSMDEFKGMVTKNKERFPQLEQYSLGIEEFFREHDVNKDGVLEKDEFKNALNKVDRDMKSLPSTAQCAYQEGEYLGEAFNRKRDNIPVEPFRFHYMGQFAYVGGDNAVAEVKDRMLSGKVAMGIWRAASLKKQLSWRNRISLLTDWAKTTIFGRDISRV